MLAKTPTGIPGFDELAEGGLPRGRATVISGSAGSGKTVFGAAFLNYGATRLREPGVFVTFEERRVDIMSEMAGFGWDLAGLEKRGLLAFVDASRIAASQVEVGEYDFGGLVARLRYAIGKVKAKRCVIDGIGSLFLRYRDTSLVRRELSRIIGALRDLDVTTVITAERVRDEDAVSRFGVEDFVADSVVGLFNTESGRQRERQIEVIKLRGGSHQTGKHPLLIDDAGLTVFPRERRLSGDAISSGRVSLGVVGIDSMMDGGVFRNSVTLLLGPSGTGRTVLGLHFLAAGVRRREKCLLISFEESRNQLVADADSLGMSFGEAERHGLLRVVTWQPDGRPIESCLKRLKEVADEYRPKRVVIDSLMPLANAVDEQRFRRFVVSLLSFLRSRQATTVVNYTTGDGLESSLAAESDLAVLTDNILVMSFSERDGKMERTLLVAKSRASSHDKEVRRYEITDRGFCVPIASDRVCGAVPVAPKRPARRRRR